MTVSVSSTTTDEMGRKKKKKNLFHQKVGKMKSDASHGRNEYLAISTTSMAPKKVKDRV